LGHPLNSIKGLQDLEGMSDEDVINPKECMILNAIHEETKKTSDIVYSSY
jgi:hypothetical protein